jgi:hypothetical protein
MSALSQLRHAYHQLSLGTVRDQKQFADGLIAPAIREMERHEKNKHETLAIYDKALDRLQAKVDERDAVLRQALEALEYANPLMECYWGKDSSEAIAAIRKVLGNTY